jgi:hypothetical protein
MGILITEPMVDKACLHMWWDFVGFWVLLGDKGKSSILGEQRCFVQVDF